MGRGSKRAGGVGRATWSRISATCTSARSLVHGGRREGGADREGPRHTQREREREREREGVRGATARRLAVPAHETEKEKGCAGGATGAHKSAPLGSEREGGNGARDRLLLTGGTRQSGVAGTRVRGLAGPSWAGLGQNGFSFFPEFPNTFSISFL
jgi:hypothetical protein